MNDLIFCCWLQHEQEIWLRRPLPDAAVGFLVKSVRCLFDLRDVLLRGMLKVFTDGVDIYLSVNRDSSEGFLRKREVGNSLIIS
jgi:hypothetical protein